MWPFIQAVENLQRYYFDKNMDISKTSISVPELARQKLVKSSEKGRSFFCSDRRKKRLPSPNNQNNIVKGPSTIFHCHHMVGQTHIQGNPSKPCQKTCWFNANAFYLYCLGIDMLTGSFVRRKLGMISNPKIEMNNWKLIIGLAIWTKLGVSITNINWARRQKRKYVTTLLTGRTRIQILFTNVIVDAVGSIIIRFGWRVK